MGDRDYDEGGGGIGLLPVVGAGSVEDTYNLLGHALKKALGVIARQQGWGLAEVATQAGAPSVAGTSLKAALDLDWDDPEERAQALVRVLDALDAVEEYLDSSGWQLREDASSIEIARRVREQDVEQDADGTRPTLRREVARERLVSVEHPEIRHGRKSRNQRFDVYKRHALRDLDTELV